MRGTNSSPGSRLRSAMDAGCVLMPGAFNGLCARAVARAGFEACYVSGAATSVCAGVPDVGLLSLEHFARVIREVADASGLPVLADADTGFGEAEMLRRTVIEYARAGAAGLHIEDQVMPKRCGHLEGKTLIAADHMCEKIEAAAQAAHWAARSGGGVDAIVVCARTDARGVEGFDAAVERAAAYTRAGAEMVFPEGLASEDEFARFAAAMRGLPGAPGSRKDGPYLLANMTEFGKTPMIRAQRFADLGYSCVIYPVTLLRVAMGAVENAIGVLKREGDASTLLARMQTREQLYALLGYAPDKEWGYPGGVTGHGIPP